jgi:hypothetical protein
MIKIFLILLALFTNISCNDSDTKKIILKWIPPEIPDLIELPRLISVAPTKSGFKCIWYKLLENKEIDEQGKTFGDLFIYKTSNNECSLLIPKFDPKSHWYIDFYKPNILTTNTQFSNFASNDKEPIYALAYLKSFDLIKTTIKTDVYEFNCKAVFRLPNSNDESLNEGIRQALEANLLLDGYEKLNEQGLKIPQAPSSFRKMVQKIKNILIVKSKRDTSSNSMVNDFSITLNPIEVFKGQNSKNIFMCKMELVDDVSKTIVFSKVISEDFAQTNFAVVASLKHKFVSLLLVVASFVVVYIIF